MASAPKWRVHPVARAAGSHNPWPLWATTLCSNPSLASLSEALASPSAPSFPTSSPKVSWGSRGPLGLLGRRQAYWGYLALPAVMDAGIGK